MQQLSTLDCVLKATPARWWGTHKKSISDWLQCRILMRIIFEDEINYDDQKYIGLLDPGKNIEHCPTTWQAFPR